MENQIEIWKDVIGYKGIYQVSSFGRIKSMKFKKEKILAAYLNSNGYFTLALWLYGERKDKKVHRLVAEAFLGKSSLSVNHKDGNKTNNNIENLEYVTSRDNSIHCYNSKKTCSKYVGVCWYKPSSKWRSSIELNGKAKYLGSFDTELEAYNAYLQALKDNGIDSKYA